MRIDCSGALLGISGRESWANDAHMHWRQTRLNIEGAHILRGRAQKGKQIYV